MIIDFHSHFLPNMDDGSSSIEMSLEMLKMNENAGVDLLALTPHFYARNEDIRSFIQRRQETYQLLKDAYKGPIQLLLGAEVHYYSSIANTDSSYLDQLCLENTDLLLLELPFSRKADLNTIVALNNRYQVVLAHIERYLEEYSSQELHFLLENNVFLQINAEILNKTYYNRYIEELLLTKKVHFFGTDAHNLSDRKPNFAQAKEFLSKQYGLETTNKILEYSYLSYRGRIKT